MDDKLLSLSALYKLERADQQQVMLILKNPVFKLLVDAQVAEFKDAALKAFGDDDIDEGKKLLERASLWMTFSNEL